MEQMAISFEPQRRVFSVAEITGAIGNLLESQFSDIWVSGEISGAKQATSGHFYFTLKDGRAQIQCACWRTSARYLRFKPEDGIAVLARGRIEVYPPRGQYQLIVETLEPQGHGALQLAFEQLKKTLAAEGLFAQDRKRALPPFPNRVGIVTSPSGAAIRDLVQVLSDRWPGLRVRLYPAAVQGPGSAASVVEGIRYFAESGWAEVLIVGRGGGSLEDLWTFNEEAVARAVAACPVPVVSAVGHETDFTIADFVADLRAPTPSAAAAMVVPERREVLERIAGAENRLGQAVRYVLSDARVRLQRQGVERAHALLRRRLGESGQRVDELGFRMRDAVAGHLKRKNARWQDLSIRLERRDLKLQLSEFQARLTRVEGDLVQLTRQRLQRASARLEPLRAQLDQLSPLAVLARGYAIVQHADGTVVKDAADAPPGTRLGVRLSKGRLQATVDANGES